MSWPISQRSADRGPGIVRPTRRQIVAGGIGTVVALGLDLTPADAADLAEMDIDAALRKTFGTRTATVGRVRMDLPTVAGSGNSVALTVTVDSPMTPADHVRRIHVFAPRNPRPLILSADLGPHAPRAELSTRIRLNSSQSVLAFAETSDGGLWRAERAVEVTIGACDSLMFRY